ncbi:hypothetical protein MNBD_NITROSPINAE02-1113 [hydrothermal vent metagenome]|uniref:UvrD-like helicase C-terminal domain-containing protein n=1 Tax=hydrothermal vent metagenome TaxID=652676 RepID=A0A3B1CP11_9ZZZZ
MNQLPTLTLYPTHQRLLSALGEVMRADEDMGAIHPGMMTIGAFEAKLGFEILGNITEASDVALSLVAAKILDDYYQNRRSGAFKSALGFRGFIPSLLSFFDELGAGLVSPEELAEISGYAPQKEEEICALYKAYRAELVKRKLTDAGMAREALITALGDIKTVANSETLSQFGAIRLVDIYQFTPYRFELFRRIAKAQKVIITAPVPDERRQAFGFIVTNLIKFESLEDREEKLEIKFEEPIEGPLAPLRDNIFELSPKRDNEVNGLKETVTIIKCSSRYREIEEVGASIYKQKKEHGLDWSDFGAVFRDINPYGAIIEDVFGRYGIPFNFKRGLPLSLNPLVRSILTIFTAIETGFARDEVLRILGSPYFTRYRKLDTEIAQKLFLKAGIIEGSKSYWSKKLAGAQKLCKGKELARAKQITTATIELLARLAGFARQMRPPSFINTLIDIIKYLKIDPDPDFTGGRAEAIRFRDNNAYAQIIEILVETREAVGDLKLGRAPLGFEKTKNILLNQINRRSALEQNLADRMSVTLLNAHDAVGTSFPSLFIAGMHENEFPRFMERSSLLHETQRSRFNKVHAETILQNHPLLIKGRQVFDKAQDKWQEEALLFYQSLKAAKERLIFTHSAQELNGEALMRSQFIDDALETIMPEATSEEREKFIETAPNLSIDKNPDELLDPEEQKMWLLKNLFHAEGGSRIVDEKLAQIVRGEDDWKNLQRLVKLSIVERARDDYFMEQDPQVKIKLLTPYLGLLGAGKELVLEHVVKGRRGTYSPTGLEKYGQCPFRYFGSAILKLGAVEEPRMEIDAMNAGSLSHSILELFYARLIKTGSLPVTGSEADLGALRRAANDAFKEFEKKGKQGDPAIWEVVKERALNQLIIFIRFEVEDQKKNGFIPVAVEERFDLPTDDGETPQAPLKIETAGGDPRYLMGFVDRIDLNESKNGVRVVDYKLGSNIYHYKSMLKPDNMGELSFQPGIYMIMAKQFAKTRGLLPKIDDVQGGYRLIGATMFNKSFAFAPGWNDSDEAMADQNKFTQKIATVIEQIEDGRFPIDPDRCDYCEFTRLCRYVSSSQVFGDGGGE